jgi:hypothetical protein
MELYIFNMEVHSSYRREPVSRPLFWIPASAGMAQPGLGDGFHHLL